VWASLCALGIVAGVVAPSSACYNKSQRPPSIRGKLGKFPGIADTVGDYNFEGPIREEAAMESPTCFTRRFPTRSGLWLTCSGVIFLLAWLLPTEVKDVRKPMAWIWVVFVSGDWSCAWSEMLYVLFALTTIFGVGAAILGWVVHALIVICIGKK
jgi:hypothetical protein